MLIIETSPRYRPNRRYSQVRVSMLIEHVLTGCVYGGIIGSLIAASII
jgi:hypothetical protein